MAQTTASAWGNLPGAGGNILPYRWRHEPLPTAHGSVLPYGNGRSYGDVCLNPNGELIGCRGLNRFIAFDREQGILQLEAGVLLSEVLALIVPAGWFLPVTPGTRMVTVGGAIANDVHGKNHHRAGSFGCHVEQFELLRSDGSRHLCSPKNQPELFAASIGGMGLTGVMTWATLRLIPIGSPMINVATQRFDNLKGFLTLSEATDQDHDYTVAWIDCLASGRNLGRGVLMAGNHHPGPASPRELARSVPKAPRLSVPFAPPGLLNRWSLSAFNSAYFHRAPAQKRQQTVPFAPFFYPLDAIGHWNRLYGKPGFYQYQCVVPRGNDAMFELLSTVSAAREGSFLAVLKGFGNVQSPGMLSFPRPGLTLALDFRNRGPRTLALLERLDTIVAESGGALYPAKDARMSPALFAQSFPNLDAFLPHLDPAFSSGLWRRVQA